MFKQALKITNNSPMGIGNNKNLQIALKKN